RLLAAGQDQAAGAGVTPTAVGPDRHHLDIEEQQGGPPRPVPPDRPQPPPDRGPLRGGATEVPPDAAEGGPPRSRGRRGGEERGGGLRGGARGGGGRAKGGGAGETRTAVGPDRHHLDIEEQQGGPARPVPPDRPQPPQDRGPLRVGATEFPLDAAKVDPPFWSTRRRCSRLMALTRRRRIAYARSLARDQRPEGRPTRAVGWAAGRQRAARCSGVIRAGAPPRPQRRTQSSPRRSKACR